MIGRRIDHYEILEKLGEGGMGAVYKARDTKLNRPVAVKVLPSGMVSDPDRVARFIQEARSASALNSPNIITIHDISSHEEGEFIVMEFVDGRTLGDAVAGGELRLPEILKIAVQVADALAAAHSAGIIHRDLKPSNIMIAESGLVKILDFGLAKLTADAVPEHGRTMTLPRSDPGMIVGTVGYMSPEQVRGQPLDRRSDIFNFGLILYEMLSGTRAFQGETSVEVMSAILKEPAADLPESVPAPLRQIVSVCIEKNPANRFESARDIGFALRALQAGSSLSGALPKIETAPAKRKWFIAAIPAVIPAIAALAFAALYFMRPEPLDLSGLQYTPAATDWELEDFGIWSPDGKSIAYSKSILRMHQIMVRDLTSPFPSQLTHLPAGLGGAAAAFWSRDGSRIFFWSPPPVSELWSVGAAGGEPQKVLSGVYGEASTLSPDGNTIAFWGGREEGGKYTEKVFVSSPPGASPRMYTPHPFETSSKVTDNYVRFSPDGSKIGLSINREGRQFWLLDWPDGARAKARRVTWKAPFLGGQSFDWLPDSRHVIMSRGGLWLGDTRTGEIELIPVSFRGNRRNVSASPDGRRLLFTETQSDNDILEVPLDGSKPSPFLSTSMAEMSPSWSLAGDRMAYITTRAGKSGVWLRSAKGDWERLVVSRNDFPDEENASFFNAVLSPDGSRLAFNIKGQKTGTKIWIMPSAGGKPLPAVASKPEVTQSEYGFSWSPDGNSIACIIAADAVLSLAVVKVGSERPPDLIGEHGTMQTTPAWSPDGRWIAFGKKPAVERAIVLISPDGQSRRSLPIPTLPFLVVWSRDSSTIYVCGGSFPYENRIDAVDVRTGKTRKIIDLGPEAEFGVPYNYTLFGSLSADGRSFLTTRVVYTSDLWILDGFRLPGRRRR